MIVADSSALRATPPLATRIRRALRWLASPLKPFFVALIPDRSVGPEVVAGRYGWPLLGVIICACVAAFALTVGKRRDAYR